jgi:hemolysin III
MKNAVAALPQGAARNYTITINGARRQHTIPVFYTKGEEIFNAVTHIVGGAFGLAAWIVLAYFAYPNMVAFTAVSIFSLSIIILYTMSALYHFLPVGMAKAVFRVFDHCTIFLLIAGTYTPYCLIVLGGTQLGITIFIAEWVLAVAGITMNAIAMKNKVIKAISMVLYVAMGWFIVISFKLLLTGLSPASFWLLLAGGIAYTSGLIFFGFGKKVKYFHSIWHLFDLAGTILQTASILLMVLAL